MAEVNEQPKVAVVKQPKTRIDQQQKATSSYLAYLVGTVVVLAAVLYSTLVAPTLRLLGTNQVYGNINNQDCHVIKELSGCEDQWIDRASGLSYLACTPLTDQKHAFFPPVHHLNTTALPLPYTQSNMGSFMAILDTATESVTKLKIEGFPEDSFGLFALHGLDLWVDRSVSPAKATVFVINHLPPPAAAQGDHSAAFKHGADSVVEIFETELGSGTLTWKETFRNQHVKTPNNIVALSPTSFYITNDHADGTSFTRKHLSPLLFPTSDISYCNTENKLSKMMVDDCFVAASGLNYPNGITKGPGFMFYASSSAKGYIYVFQQQVNNMLLLVETIKLGKIPDNIHVTEEGHIIVALITKFVRLRLSRRKLMEYYRLSAFHQSIESSFARKTVVQPVQAMRVSNSSHLIPSALQHYKIETIFEDPGTTPLKLQTATNVQYYKEKLYLTSCFSELAICNVGKI